MPRKTPKSAQLTIPTADNDFVQIFIVHLGPHVGADWVRRGPHVSRTGFRSWGIRCPLLVRRRNRGKSLRHQSSPQIASAYPNFRGTLSALFLAEVSRTRNINSWP